MNDILTGAYDFLLNKIKIKQKPTTLHQKTCPICDSKRVNVYYSNQLDKYICKKCMDKLLDEKGE
jgi:transposase-like protein